MQLIACEKWLLNGVKIHYLKTTKNYHYEEVLLIPLPEKYKPAIYNQASI